MILVKIDRTTRIIQFLQAGYNRRRSFEPIFDRFGNSVRVSGYPAIYIDNSSFRLYLPGCNLEEDNRPVVVPYTVDFDRVLNIIRLFADSIGEGFFIQGEGVPTMVLGRL